MRLNIATLLGMVVFLLGTLSVSAEAAHAIDPGRRIGVHDHGTNADEAAFAKLEAALAGIKAPTGNESVATRFATAEQLFAAGKYCHDLVLTNKAALGKQGIAYFELSNSWQHDPLTLAYLGSLNMLMARDVESVMEKTRRVDIALPLLDQAVAEDPTNLVIRRIRIENNLSLPAMFKRLDVVTEDVNYLLGLFAKTPGIFASTYDPAMVFVYKAREQILREKPQIAERYLSKAKEIARTNEIEKIIARLNTKG